MGSNKPKAVGHVIIRASGMVLNDRILPDVNVSTDVFEGETIAEAIGRAHAEQQRAKAAPPPPPPPPPRKRVRSKVVKRLPKGGGDGR